MVERYIPDPANIKPFSKTMTPYLHFFEKNMEAAASQPTLHEPGHIPPDPDEVKRFQLIVGALLYSATVTRPDVAYPVSMLCQHMRRPTPALFEEANYALSYLYHTREVGLLCNAVQSDLSTMSDSNWATRRSTSGHTFQWHRCTIDWGTKQKTSIALSSCKADIMAGLETAKSVSYYRQLLEELGFPPSGPTELAMDNKAGINLAYNAEHHDRTKHIERCHLFIREMVENFKISVPYVRTADNIADFFTKALPAVEFYRFRNIIMNIC